MKHPSKFMALLNIGPVLVTGLLNLYSFFVYKQYTISERGVVVETLTAFEYARRKFYLAPLYIMLVIVRRSVGKTFADSKGIPITYRDFVVRSTPEARKQGKKFIFLIFVEALVIYFTLDLIQGIVP